MNLKIISHQGMLAEDEVFDTWFDVLFNEADMVHEMRKDLRV